jgi:hypothetical protein
MEAKLKHLEFIQAAIARMSNASFLFKGWAISLAGALFGFAVVRDELALALIASISTVLFWGLDGYYLWLERGFIQLHAKIAKLDSSDIDFDMRIDKTKASKRWLKTCVRPHLLLFYGTVLAIEVIGIFAVRGSGCGT